MRTDADNSDLPEPTLRPLWLRVLTYQWQFGPFNNAIIAVWELLFFPLLLAAGVWAQIEQRGVPTITFVGLTILYILLKQRQRPQLPQFPVDKSASAQITSLTPPDAGGWLTARVVQIRFPPECPACGIPTTNSRPLRVGGWGHELVFTVPICPHCQKHEARKFRAWGWTGAAVGAAAAAPVGMWAANNAGFEETAPWLVMIACVCVVGSILGGVVGALFAGRHPPVQVGHYSWRHGTLAVRFLRPDYAEKFAAAVQPPE